jgi:hypothetical protein
MGWFATLKENRVQNMGYKIRLEKIGSGFFVVIQKEKRQHGLFSFKLQITRRKIMVQNLKKRVDATLYFFF